MLTGDRDKKKQILVRQYNKPLDGRLKVSEAGGKQMEFNEKLQQLRTERNLTQEQLAEQLYVSRTAISKWESGKATLT